MDLADELTDWFLRDSAEQVENGEFDGRQRCADGNAVVAEVEPIDKNLFQQQVQVPGILPEKERLQVVGENRLERLQPTVPDRYAFRPVPRTYPAKEIVLVPK